MCYANGGNNGRITAFAYGGTGTLFPLWSNGPGGYTDSNLIAGTYTITVTDSNLCTASLTESITQPAAINLQLDSQEALCYGGSDGYAWAISTGGVSPYSYSWSNSNQTDTATGLSTNGSPYYCYGDRCQRMYRHGQHRCNPTHSDIHRPHSHGCKMRRPKEWYHSSSRYRRYPAVQLLGYYRWV